MLRRLRDGKTCRVPKRTRAADAIAANPQMSNVAIADEIGVDEKTVRKARPASDKSKPDEGTVTLIENLQTKVPWPQRFTLRLSLGATLA